MGKFGAGAPGVVSREAAGSAEGSGNDRRHVAVGFGGPSSSPPASPIAPSTPTRRFEGIKKLRFRNKNDTETSSGSSSSCTSGDVDLSASKTTNPTTATASPPTSSAALAALAAPPTSSSSFSSSSSAAALVAALAVPPNAREIRDHVAKFTARSDWLGTLVVAETAAGWLLTAAAPTLFDRCLVRRRAPPSSPSPPSGAALAAAASLFFHLTWVALRACSYVRTVILMHDLVHGVVFSSRRLNAAAAALAGLCAWTSAANFGRNHRRHHARLAVEEEIDFDADHTVFWTVKEWNAWRPGVGKFLARLLRDPAVYHFVTAPAYLLFFGSTSPGEEFYFFPFIFSPSFSLFSKKGRGGDRNGTMRQRDETPPRLPKREKKRERKKEEKQLTFTPRTKKNFLPPLGYGPGLSASQTLWRLLKDHWTRILGVVVGFSSIALLGSLDRFWLELAAGWTGLVIGAAIFGLQHDAIAPPLRGYRAPAAAHSRDAAALRGSTYIVVPRWLSQRVLLGIEHHHIHHLDARVPCYRLSECHASAPEGSWQAAGVPVLRGWSDIRRGLSVALWDEDERQFVKFPPLLPVKRGQAAEAWRRAVSVVRERLRR